MNKRDREDAARRKVKRWHVVRYMMCLATKDCWHEPRMIGTEVDVWLNRVVVTWRCDKCGQEVELCGY